MRDKVADVRDGSAILIYFEPVAQALLNEGKVRESFQAYRDLIALHPNEAVHHLQMARALLAAGMGEAARDEAHRAVALQPDSALAQKTLAAILECDLVGRNLRPGSDFAGAEAALRAAQKLDPDDNAIRGNLAIFLEYNKEGDRYAPGAKLKESVLEYQTLTPEQLTAIELKNNPAFALFYAREFAEARKYAESLNPQLTGVIVASEAAMNGGPAGIAEAGKRSGGEEERKATMKTAGELLMRARIYAPAADLMEAGASGQNASSTMALAALLRKARPHEEIHYNDDAAGAAMQSFLILGDPNLTWDKTEVLSSRSSLAVSARMDQDERDLDLKAGRQMRRGLSRTGFPADIMLDLTLQSIDPKAEGDDASGYRVTLPIPGSSNVVMYVVKEDGKYKILDSSKNPNSIGLEILDRVAANNLPGARILLDWVRDEQHLVGGDDTVAGYSFPRIWTKGMDADAARMKLAAAAILVESKPTAAQGVAILEAARSSATSDTDKLNISLALLQGYRHLDDFEKVLAISTDLAKQYPESLRLFWDQIFALRGLRKFQDMDALAADRLKRLPDDIEAHRSLMNSAIAREDFVLAHDLGVKIVQSGKAEAGDWNNVAWYALFTGKVTQDDVADALKALQLNQNNASSLHTLGCVYAELNKTKDAREVLIQAMDLLTLDEPESNYWYAFGRIAEQYGEIEVAKADYARVTRPKREMEIPGSSYQLAQNRLKIMATPPQNATSAKN
jgi:Flp pilus assembly protein TadD